MEAETVIQRIAGAKKISSIFFGGGTPSLMSPNSIKVRQASYTMKLDSILEI